MRNPTAHPHLPSPCLLRLHYTPPFPLAAPAPAPAPAHNLQSPPISLNLKPQTSNLRSQISNPPHHPQRQPRDGRGRDPDGGPGGGALAVDAADGQAGVDEGVGAGDDGEQQGAACHGAGGVGPAPPAVPAQGLGQGGGGGVEAGDGALAGAVDGGALGGGEDEGARGEAQRERRGQHPVDPGALVGGRQGGHAPEVRREVGRQVRRVGAEQRHAVDGAREERRQQRDGPVRDDLGVGRVRGLGVRRGERPQQPEGQIGRECFDGEGEEERGRGDFVEGVEEVELLRCRLRTG